MALIKSEQAGQMIQDVIVLDLGDLRKEGDRIRNTARAEADSIINQAKIEAERIKEIAETTAHQKGLNEGRTQGLKTGRDQGHAAAMAEASEKLKALQDSWAGALGTWETQRRQMFIEARQSLLELALMIARKIVRRMPKVNPEMIIDQVAAAIEAVARPGDVTVHVHRCDKQMVSEALSRIVEIFSHIEHAKLVEDQTVDPGGCLVTYGKGCIDATLEGQLERLTEALLPEAVGQTGGQTNNSFTGNDNNQTEGQAK